MLRWRLSLFALAVIVLTLPTIAFGVRRPISYVPTGTGVMKVSAGTQATAASAVDLTADVTGTLPAANGGAGWVTALDCDITAEGSQTLSSDTTYSFCGHTWTKFNTANEASAATVGASGLTFQPGSTSDYTTGTRTIPGVSLPLSSLFTLVDGMRVRAQIYISAFNGAANYDAVNFGFDSQSTTWGYVSARGYNSAAVGINTFLIVNATNLGSQTLAATIGAANNCIQVEVYQMGDIRMLVRTGQYSSGWPTVWTPAKSYIGATGTDISSFVLSNMAVVIGAKRAGSGTSLTATIARVRVDYAY